MITGDMGADWSDIPCSYFGMTRILVLGVPMLMNGFL